MVKVKQVLKLFLGKFAEINFDFKEDSFIDLLKLTFSPQFSFL